MTGGPAGRLRSYPLAVRDRSLELSLKEVVGVQYLRAVAAFSVVVFHSLLYVNRFDGKTPYWVSIFAGGVDLFFVISGYIIWSSTDGKALSPWSWWKSRLIRIVPLFWVTLVAWLAVGHLSGSPNHHGVVEIVKAFLFIPVFDSQTGELAPFFVPGWTLDYEFFFYVLMAFTLTMKRPSARLACLVAVLGALVVSRRYSDPSNAVAFAFSSPLTFEFVAGIVVAMVTRKLRLGQRDWIVGVASLALAVLVLAVVSPRLYAGAPRALYFGLPAALIVFGTVCLERLLRLRTLPWLKLLGDSSYSLYLGHEFVLYGVLAAMTSWVAPSWWAVDIAVAAGVCLLFGLAVHKAIEKPLLSVLRGKRKAGAAAPTAATAA
jgi:exopolysaccharide production protein ExoZ